MAHFAMERPRVMPELLTKRDRSCRRRVALDAVDERQGGAGVGRGRVVEFMAERREELCFVSARWRGRAGRAGFRRRSAGRQTG